MHPHVPHNELVRSFQRDAVCFLDVCLFAQGISRYLAKSRIHRLPMFPSLFRAFAKAPRVFLFFFSASLANTLRETARGFVRQDTTEISCVMAGQWI